MPQQVELAYVRTVDDPRFARDPDRSEEEGIRIALERAEDGPIDWDEFLALIGGSDEDEDE